MARRMGWEEVKRWSDADDAVRLGRCIARGPRGSAPSEDNLPLEAAPAHPPALIAKMMLLGRGSPYPCSTPPLLSLPPCP